MAIEEIKDIEGAEHLYHTHGDKFLGWYASQSFKRKETLPLNYRDKDLKYDFSISLFNYRFVMPPVIKFVGGLITYSLGDRELGVFRFPQDEKGDFISPIHLESKDLTNELSSEGALKMLSMPPPIVFNAFKISQFEFEFIDISPEDFQALANITDSIFADQLKSERDRLFNQALNDVLERIKSSCNYLLILQNILDKKLTDFSEVSKMTNQIISI